MTDTATQGRALTPVQAYLGEVLPPEKRGELYSSLPAHVSPARFERNLANAIMREPKLLRVDPRIVYREVCKIAALGLVLDPQLGEAYLIVDKKGDVQARIGYRGLIKLARQSGDVDAIYAHDICENDACDIQLGTEKRIEHKPNFMQPRGQVGAYYAVVRFKGGVTDFEVMSIDEVNAIRDRSDAWRAFKKGLITATPWNSDPAEMSKKTVLRRLLKRCPMSPDLMDALAREDEADSRDMIHVEPVRQSDRIMARLQGRAAGPGFSPEHVEREIAEATGSDTGLAGDEDDRAATPTAADSALPHTDDASAITGPSDDDAFPGDTPADAGDQVSQAYLDGMAARKRGARNAPPAALANEGERMDWSDGWREQDEAMKGGRA